MGLRKMLKDRSERKAEERAEQERQIQEQQERERLALQAYRNNQNAIVETLEDGKVPLVDIDTHNFKMLKTEYPFFILHNVEYLEQRTKRETRGKSAGTSVRVAKGVSVRMGASKGKTVEYDQIESRGIGSLLVTSKHVSFDGNQRSARIKLDKIVSVSQEGSNAVRIVRDRASQQPEFFIVGERDAGFIVDLIHAVESAEIPRKPETIVIDETSYLGTGDVVEDPMVWEE